MVAVPDLPHYSAAFQAMAADELAVVIPCDAVEPVPPCSALARMSIDYGRMREQIRTVK